MELSVPATKPTSSAKEKPSIIDPPKKYKITTVTMVSPEVKIVRESVAETLSLIIGASSFFLLVLMPSLMRSKMIIVSLSE